MTDPLTVKPNAQIREEASSWFVEFSEGEVTLQVREAFCAWLKASPEHVRAYLAISATYDDLGRLTATRTADAQRLVERIMAEGNVMPLPIGSTSRPFGETPEKNSWFWRARGSLAAAAAVTSVVIGLGAWQLWFAGLYST